MSNQPPLPDPPQADRERVNILIVDDRPEQLLVLESILADLGQNIVRASSGREALRFLLANECALILLDVNMPGLDGFETASLIRQRPRSKQTPIIFVTAYDETETHVSRGYSLGAVDYIHTPVMPEMLLAKASVFVDLAMRTEQVRRQAERLELRVQERTAELQALNVALEAEIAERERVAQDRTRLLSETQEAVRRRDEFLAILAHELRNPLASIVSGAELMRICGMSDPDSETARDIIERQAGHMSSLLRDLLDISRITRGKIELRREVVDINTIIGEVVENRPGDLTSGLHEISVTLCDEPLLVNADRTRIQQVLANLLSNAAKYTEPGGRIFISAAREGGSALIRVRDTGVGIAPEMLPRIFEPFVQVKQSHSRPSEGLGIGLAMVRRLVELHDGSVEAFSAGPDRGSEFTVTVPIAAAVIGAVDSPLHGKPVESIRAASLRIIVVEDNEDVRKLLGTLLDADGHGVESCSDGPSGISLIRRLRPEVALIDIGLPGCDGYEVAAQIRADVGCNGVRLIAMTGYGQPEDFRRALAAGFDSHLVKPVQHADLARMLGECAASLEAAGKASTKRHATSIAS